MRNFDLFTTRMDLSLCFPRIHALSGSVCKMLDVSGCQRRPAGDYDRGDLQVARMPFERLSDVDHSVKARGRDAFRRR
jgi:hypothetical protein